MMATMMVTWVVRWFVNLGASFFVFGTMSRVVIAILCALGAELSEEAFDELSPMNSPIPASQREL